MLKSAWYCLAASWARLIAVPAILMLVFFAPHLKAQPGADYTFVSIPGLTQATGIDNLGLIVGFKGSSGLMDVGGTFTPVSFPGQGYTTPNGINSSGTIAGHSGNYGQSAQHGFRDAGGAFSTIDFPGATSSLATGLNDSGQIVGYYYDVSGNIHGFLYVAGIFTPIDFPGATSTRAYGINSSGEIVGTYSDPFRDHGFAYYNGFFYSLDFPGSSDTNANAIDTSGIIAGNYSLPGSTYGFIYANDVFSTVQFPGSASTIVWGINDSGQIVGTSGLAGFSATPVAVPQTIMFSALSNLTLGFGTFTLTATASSGLTVTFASNFASVCTVSVTTVTLVAAGTCSVTASQSGNPFFSAATPVTQTFEVAQIVSATSLTSSANFSIVSQSITLTAMVSPSTATGSVTFKDGTITVGTAILTGGTATLILSTLTVGSHALTAVYGGDTNDAGSISSVLTQTVNQPVAVQPRVGGLLTCTPVTISGPYGFAISGFIPTSKGRMPFADQGTFAADGNGSFTGFSTTSTGGTIVTRAISGTYSIGTNCTGATTFLDTGGNTLHLSFAVVDNGSEIQFIQTDIGTVVAGRAQRAATSCDSSAVSGSYTYTIKGWVAAGGAFQPFADAGRIVADGSGNFTGQSTYSASGAIIRRTLAGAFSIGSACSGTATIRDNFGNVDKLAVAVLSNGQLLLIQSDNGTILSGGAQRGQYACSTGSLTGPYAYANAGFNISTSGIIPEADSGLYTSDGNGHISGTDARIVTGSYSVNSDCTGSAILTDAPGNSTNLDLFVAEGGAQVQFIQTDSGVVLSGSARQQPSGTCSNAALSGSYGYALEGWTAGSGFTPFADAGQLTADGAGNLSAVDTASAGGTIIARVLSGSYQVNSDCTGSMSLQDSMGDTTHLDLTASSDSRQAGFIQTDPGTVITGNAQRQLAFSSDAIVNAASYAPGAVVPGSLFAVFGDALSQNIAVAGTLPWPTQLGATSVSINGIGVPLYYVSPTQIDGQLPLEIQPGPAQLVVSDGLTSVAVAFNVANAGPGIITYGLSRAIAVNPDGSLNGPADPANGGDIVVVYLTGGGPVNLSGPWITGAASPSGLSTVSLPFTVTIGGLAATVDYLGLTPTEVGLYQLNVHIPILPAGDQALVITVGGNFSNTALISVAP
jgi:uncharacterized protein (TIGR03437 family)